MTRIWDSFDAITMNCPYHQSVSSDQALRILERDAHCYDPDLLRQFCVMVRGNRLTEL